MEQKELITTPELFIRDIASIAGCSQQTVRRYEQKGFLTPVRDHNGFRRYTMLQARMLRKLFLIRQPVQN
jgi:DNA-binding transcriptional MerR regulator